MKNNTCLSIAFTTLACIFSTAALAQATTVRVGWVQIDPKSSASSIYGPFTPTDALSLNVSKQSTLFFSVAREIEPNLEVELALGIPPTHDNTLVVKDASAVTPGVAALNGQVAATVRQIAPTLFFNYRFDEVGGGVRPFIGAGINYTVFDNATSTAVNDRVNGGPTSIKLSSSAGLAFQVGATAQISGPWSANVVWSTAQIKTKMTSNTLGIERNADVTMSPSVITLSLGYTF
jgi:outer membrane protein